MKKITLFCVSLFVVSTTSIIAQSGAKYATDGNATNSGDVFGTTNSQPLNFVTNNVLRMVLDVNGQLKVVNLAGTGSRFLQSDANGNLISFPTGNSNEVLYGNGTWAALPAGATSWQIAGNNLLATNTGNVGIGTNVPQYKLDVIGDARISNNLYVGGGIVITDKVQAAHEVTTMTMRADSIKMDASKAIYGTTRIEGDIDAKNKMDVQGNATFNGTLKVSNLAGSGTSKVYSDPAGNLFKGPGVPATWECINGTPNWNIGGNNFSGMQSGFPGLLDANIGTCDDADFILKSNDNPKIWLKGTSGNEFIGFGTSAPADKFHFSSGDARFDNHVGIGTTSAPYKKLTVVGDVSLINYGSGAGPGADGFEILGNSQIPTRRGISLEPDPDGDVCFFIHNWQSASGLPEFKFKNGINFGSNSQAQNFASAPDLMVIDGLGKVTVNNYYGGPTDDAFIIKNGNTGAINFKVKKNGYAYAREINVMPTTIPFPDYVFESEYELMTLENLEVYLKSNKHLPNIPSAKIVEKEGINLGEMQIKQMEKLEEAFLYILQLKKENENLKKRLDNLEKTK